MQLPFAPVVVITKREVLAMDTSSALNVLSALIASPQNARGFFGQVEIAFNGYDETTEELFEIESVRSYIYKLDEKFPYWLYFLTKSGTGLQCIAYCFLPPFLTPEAKQIHFPERLNDLLTRRWFPAMNQLCEWTEFTAEQVEQLTDECVYYLLTGPIDA